MISITHRLNKFKKPRILDLGFGNGQKVIFFANRNAEVTAVDISKEKVRAFRKLLKERNINNIRVINKDMREFKIKRNYFHFINIDFVVHFFKKPIALSLINNIKSALISGGIFSFSGFSTSDPGFKGLGGYFEPHELRKIFDGWKIIRYKEERTKDRGHTRNEKPHQHHIIRIVAQKP